MRIGYKRVIEGTKVNPEKICKKLGVDRVYIDESTALSTSKPNLKELLAFAREGDIIIVDSICELASRSKELLKFIETVAKKGVNLIAKAEHFDTSTPAGKQVIIFCVNMLNLDRQFAMKYKRTPEQKETRGRKAIPIDEERFALEYDLWKKGGQTATQMMRKLGLTSSTFYRRLRAYEELQSANTINLDSEETVDTEENE